MEPILPMEGFLNQWCPPHCAGTTLESVEVLHQDTIFVVGTLFVAAASEDSRSC